MLKEQGSLDVEPITTLKGVGQKVADNLAGLGIKSVADMLFHLPYRYEDRSKVIPIGALQAGTSALFEGRVELAEVVFRGRRSLLVQLNDNTGFITLRFFHFSASQKAALQRGQWLRCYGDVRSYRTSGLDVVHPEYQHITEDQRGQVSESLTAVYPMTEGLRQASLRKFVKQALLMLNAGAELRDNLPERLLQENGWPSLKDSLNLLHNPVTMPVAQLTDQPEYTRLVYEELLAHHLSLSRLRNGAKKNLAAKLAVNQRLQHEFLNKLGFSLTGAQKRVVADIAADLQQTTPMQRLLQGDVGSGKTVVAACAAMMAYASGKQVAIMSPTELLAQQHLKTMSAWLQPLGIRVAWLVGKHKGKAYESITEAIRSGKIDVIIGTQSLFQDKVEFADLGLIIIDEQHRFGVHQRLALRDKGVVGDIYPHQLVMTATPIPRTLAMLGYADLDLSVIDELPPGRTAVTTSAMSVAKRDHVIQRVKQGVDDGRQVYWVCTLVEESEVLQCQAAEVAHEVLQVALPGIRIGLIHGRMKADEKQAAMQAFKQHDLDILVATTVIEVGVDVPNASLMVIENAERLGLAQLHQLRGRVGRGQVESHCVLLYQPPLSKNANERLAILRQTTDGFKIAEKDMQLRGPGELLGKRQAGFMQFKLADLKRDAYLMDRVAAGANEVLQNHPQFVDTFLHRWLSNSVEYAQV
ncbi:MAG: ATP-dependent DNA helicase RecG [Piscirickettsiaceae bacterium]|nr:MAG: ATP-dependent DNA helicase RecG [Piscirickettsiaceae bacterium]